MLRLTLLDGTDAIVTVRNVPQTDAQLAFLQPVDAALADWRNAARLEITLLFFAGLILALLAGGMALMTRIRPGDGYVTAVLPAVVVFGLGLAATVAPVTATVLAAADQARTGLASGISNAVARCAQLGAVAVAPWLAGLPGDEIHQPIPLAEGFPRAMLALAGVALAGAVLAWTTVADGPLDDSAGG